MAHTYPEQGRDRFGLDVDSCNPESTETQDNQHAEDQDLVIDEAFVPALLQDC
ncbi:MAG TPA: hypothetical protein VK781_05115 [Solirubrobacteraceae bacterium]|jgi:hypothetical protein|nr:hypothetical protein [Solirubrobacteraceae bacterium]